MRPFTLLMLGSLTIAGCANSRPLTPPGKPGEIAQRAAEIPQSQVGTGFKLARIQERQGNLRKALEMYQAMHRTEPQNAEICHRLVIVHSRLDEHQEADAFFAKCDQLKPDNAELYADYGYACYLRGDLQKAETWLKKAHELRPNEDRITGNLALVMGAQGREQEALTYYRQFLDDAEAQANLAYALTQRGDFPAAQKRYAKALELAPDLKSAKHALLQLAEMEKSHKEAKASGKQRKPLSQRPRMQAAPNPAPKPALKSAPPAAEDPWQSTGTASIRS